MFSPNLPPDPGPQWKSEEPVELAKLKADLALCRPLVEALAEYRPVSNWANFYICQFCKAASRDDSINGFSDREKAFFEKFPHKPSCPVLTARQLRDKWRKEGG